MRFLGDYSAKTDSKGRVFLPAAFRKVLDQNDENKMVLRNDTSQNCLVLYPKSVWLATVEEIWQRINPWSKKDMGTLERFLAGGSEVECDSQGRILIPREKLEFAGIENEVRFLAVLDRIMIWSKSVYEEMRKGEETLGEDLEELFSRK